MEAAYCLWHRNREREGMMKEKKGMVQSGAAETISRSLAGWGYEQPCLIGTGAFAQVYRVTEKKTGRILACKVSREKELLRRESLVLQRIHHPLFPSFFQWRENPEWGFLLQEYVEGVVLKELVEQQGAFEESQAMEIVVALAEGVSYLHEQNPPIIFRDIKPENILVKETGGVKLVDLGSAASDEVSGKAITGTEGYAPPEQWRNVEWVGAYSDVYALGKVLLFMLGKQGKSGHLMQVAEECICEDIVGRIPDMRCFLRRIRYRNGKYRFQVSVVK